MLKSCKKGLSMEPAHLYEHESVAFFFSAWNHPVIIWAWKCCLCFKFILTWHYSITSVKTLYQWFLPPRQHLVRLWLVQGFLGGSDGKESACNAGDWGLIPGSRRSPGEENGNPLQYFFFFWIIVLQNFVVFCHTSMWISHRYTYIPSLSNLPPITLPTPVFLPGEFHGQRSLVGYSPWGCKKLNATWRLTLSLMVSTTWWVVLLVSGW